MRNLIATLVFIGFSVVAFAQTLSEVADKQFDLKAFDQAINSYKKILKDNPKDVKALTNLADAYFYTNNMKEALSAYKKAVALPDVDSEALFRYGKAFMRSGDYSNAEKTFKAYAKTNKKVGEHYENYALMAAKTAGLPPFYQVKREYLNTKGADFFPTFLGDKVVYSSSRTDIKRKLKTKDCENWTGKSYNQLLITKTDKKGFLQKPKLLASDLAFNYNEGPVAYNGNNNKIVAITKNQFVNGHTLASNLEAKMTLLQANYQNSGDWGKAKAMSVNEGEYSTGFPSFSPDGNTLFFSSNRPGGQGGYDIYVSYYKNEKWTEPTNLGSPVNTPGDEITPFMDGRTLFYSSDWLPGLGGFDLYRAEQEGAISMTGWSKVFHMGTGINSSYDDFGFIYNKAKNIGYFTSNRRGTKSSEDIFQVTKVSDKIEILVLNASDSSPLKGVTIDFSECGESALFTNKNGQSIFQALAGLNCNATIKKAGFKSQKLKVVSTGKKKSRNYIVKLVQAGEEYIGKVVDSENNQAIEEVLVSATGKDGVLKTFSDENGEFVLPLKKEETYTVTYSKAGFTDVVNKVETADGQSRTILGIQPMNNAYSDVAFTEKGPKAKKVSLAEAKQAEEKAKKAALAAKKAEAVALKLATAEKLAKQKAEAAKKAQKAKEAASAKAVKDAENAAEEAKKAAEESAAAAKKLAEKLAEAEANAKKEARTAAKYGAANKNKAAMTKKYAVQVAAYVNDGKSINMSKYKRLFEQGNVYSRPSDRHVKIRVGVYDTKAEASKHLKAIRKAGFKQAFVTSEYLDKTKEDKSLLLGKSAKSPVANKKPVAKKAKKKAEKKSTRQYFVQLAAYKNANIKKFPTKKVQKLGKIVNRKGRKYTTMYITGFDTLEDAIQARNKATTLGFNGPFIVYKKKGKFIRMKF